LSKLSLISEKANLSEKIIRKMYPASTDEEIVQKSKHYMTKSLLDLQIWYSALMKEEKNK